MNEISSSVFQNFMFKRRGAWFGIAHRDPMHGNDKLYLSTCRGAMSKAPQKDELISIYPTFEGRRIAYTCRMDAAELTILSAHGSIRFTFADTTKLMAEGDPGMGLMLRKDTVRHETVHPRKGGAWEAVFRLTSNFIFKGLEGSTFDFNHGGSYWRWEDLSSGEIVGLTHPNEEGQFTLVMEEFQYGGYPRETYPTYAQARASMQADWDTFYAMLPPFRGELENKRYESEYILWSMLTAPSGHAHHYGIRMYPNLPASQWQMSMNSVALMDAPEISLSLLMASFDHMSPEGQLADYFDDSTWETQRIKPPVTGWAVLQIMRRHDLLRLWGRSAVEELYDCMVKWADFFIHYRDEDGSGLPTAFHGDECGMDGNALFADHLVIIPPDMCAYVALLFEANGKLAQLLGKEAEGKAWMDRSKSTIEQMIALLWDGERFVGLTPFDHRKVRTGTIVHYMPTVLGDRLPREILDKMVEDLCCTDTFLTPYGLCMESMAEDRFFNSPYSTGCVLPPPLVFICTGLWDSHRKEEARMFAQRFCEASMKHNFPSILSTIYGAMNFRCTWTRCANVILGSMLAE